MYQVTFSEQSIEEVNRLSQMEQMRLVETLSSLNIQAMEAHPEKLGRFHRDGKTFYRLRAGGFRIYFEIQNAGSTLMAHYILPHHSFKDFLFRFKLPVSEEIMAEQHPNFWQYLSGGVAVNTPDKGSK